MAFYGGNRNKAGKIIIFVKVHVAHDLARLSFNRSGKRK